MSRSAVKQAGANGPVLPEARGVDAGQTRLLHLRHALSSAPFEPLVGSPIRAFRLTTPSKRCACEHQDAAGCPAGWDVPRLGPRAKGGSPCAHGCAPAEHGVGECRGRQTPAGKQGGEIIAFARRAAATGLLEKPGRCWASATPPRRASVRTETLRWIIPERLWSMPPK